MTYTCRVSPATRSRIAELKAQGVNIGELMDKWVLTYAAAKYMNDFGK